MIDMHIHTKESDGNKTMECVLELCIKNKIKVFAITDHWKTKRYSHDFYVNDFKKYIDSCNRLKDKAANCGFTVFSGLEIDFSKDFGYPINREDLKMFNRMDFILFEYVDTKKESWGTVNGRPIEQLYEMRDYLKIPVGLAHNDFFKNYKEQYEDVINEMSKNEIFLELCEGEPLGKEKMNSRTLKKILDLKKNLSHMDIYKKNMPIEKKKHMRNNMFYFEHFPERLWMKIKKHRLKLSISTDSHNGNSLGVHPIADKYFKKYNLFNHLILGVGKNYEVTM